MLTFILIWIFFSLFMAPGIGYVIAKLSDTAQETYRGKTDPKSTARRTG
jgi:hypothetical protein